MTLILKADTPMAAPGAAPIRRRALPVSGAAARWVADTVPVGEYATSWVSVVDGGPTLTYTQGEVSAPTSTEAGGIKFLEFDGTTDGLTAPLSLPQPHSLVMVVRTYALNSADLQVLAGDESYPGGEGDAANVYVAGPISNRTLRISGGAPTVTPVAPNDQWAVLVAVFDGASTVLRLDGVEHTVSAGTAPREAVTFGHYKHGSNHARMDLAEAAIYPFALNASQRAATATELRGVYGL